MRKTIYLLFLFSIVSQAVSQQKVHTDDTLTIEYSIAATKLEFKKLPYYELDGFQHYRPLGKNRLPMARTGNSGLSNHSFNLKLQDWDINYNVSGYSSYLMLADSMRYYKMSRPFTQLQYANGSKEEQIFQFMHSQNIGEGLNISFEYQRITSSGYYLRQLSNHTQFNTTFNLHSRNKKFRSQGYFLINNIEAQENGGVVISEEDSESNIVLLDINLEAAQNRARTQSFGTINEYDFIQTDSSKALFNVSHEFNWNKSFRNYQDVLDGTEGYYSTFSIDSLISKDSSFAQNISNVIMLNAIDKQLNIGFKNEQYHYFQNFLLDSKFSSNYLVAEIVGEPFGLKVKAKIEKGISGYHKEELDWNTSIGFSEWKGIQSVLYVDLKKKQADYFLQYHRTNHAYYERDFETSEGSTIALKSIIKEFGLKLDFGLNQFSNYIYLDSNAIPQQYASSFSNFFIEIDKKFTFLKHLNLKNRIRYQSIPKSEIIAFPELISYHSLYYENAFFRNSFFLQVGIDLYYIGLHEGYQYSPSQSQFYLRNQPSDLGNNVQFDLFLNMRVNKSARIFVKMENINSSGFSKESYRVQDYTIPGRSMKLGLSWRMIN